MVRSGFFRDAETEAQLLFDANWVNNTNIAWLAIFDRVTSRLGRGLILLDPESNGGRGERSEEVSRELVEAGRDAAEVFEFAEEPLDAVALAVDFGIDRAADPDIALAGDVSAAAHGFYEVNDTAREVAAISNDAAPQCEAGKQFRRCGLVGGLARSKDQPHGQPARVDHDMDLGAQSASRSSDGVIRGPFFPPASC